MKKILLAVLFTQAIPAYSSETTSPDLNQILAGKHRSAEHKQRDNYQHPQQTLEFFDIQQDMTVVEIRPQGDSWYTEILAPYLYESGKLYSAYISNAVEADANSSVDPFASQRKNYPAIYGKVESSTLELSRQLTLAPEASADRVLSFCNIHDWMKNDQAAQAFNAMFKSLKPGGILGVIEHRNSNLKPQDIKANNGYVSEDYVIALARKAGFEYLGKSEINANSKDTKDYSEGVWALPPALQVQNKDKKKYLGIGESDRMTIKFIKPKPTLTSFLSPSRS